MGRIAANAERIAREAHEGQYRKWNDHDPFVVHPQRVAQKVASLPGMTEVDVAAAWLHDVIEDVAIPQGRVEEYSQRIREECGQDVLELVLELTNPTESPEWHNRPRWQKRQRDWEHIAGISDRAKRIKLVDRWDNLRDSHGAPLKLIDKFIVESRHLLRLIGHVDPAMAREVEQAIESLERTSRTLHAQSA